MAPPIFKKDNVKQNFSGAYVKEPVPGAYEWVCSFDLNSLYPNLIVQYNMSPETFIGMKDGISVEKYLDGELDFEGEDYSVAPNGAMFRKDKQGIIPAIIEEYYDFRVSIQNEMDKLIHSNGDESEIKRLENVQWAIKILLNSLYGAISNAYFIYFMLQIAEAITLGGQLSIKWAENYINNWLNNELKTKNVDYVVYVDTDSLYITLKDFLKQNYNGDDIVSYLDDLCKQVIGPVVIDKAYHDLFKMTNGFKNRMAMKREAICDKALWTAKKRYILNVFDNKGKRYDKPKIKMTGIEAIKSTTPEILRDKMKESFKILLTKPENESQQFVDDFKQEFKKLSPEDISFPKTANNIKKFKDKDKLYKKGTPLQVRASLLYNKLLTDKEVGNKYQAINSGDKVRYIYLKMPNPIKENVIAFPDVLPKEFDLHGYIDYNLMFEKGFLDPLDPIFKALGYSTEETVDIESFMS